MRPFDFYMITCIVLREQRYQWHVPFLKAQVVDSANRESIMKTRNFIETEELHVLHLHPPNTGTAMSAIIMIEEE